MRSGLSIALTVAAVTAALASACGGRAPRIKPGPATVKVGSCGDPLKDGIVSNRPRLRHADRDLNGDGVPEQVAADKNLCTPEGNCYWNVFSGGRAGSCGRYLGTVAGFALDGLPGSGDDGYRDLRAWWRLSGGGRLLLQQYRFQRGGYRVVDALLCREQDDDRLLCATDDPRAP